MLAAGEDRKSRSGTQVMQGYWKRAGRDRAALRDGWLHTGDIGWMDGEGYNYVVDRKKEMIKCRAFSIAPAELEAALLEHPDIADCGVVGVPMRTAKSEGFVVARKGCTLDEGGWREFFRRALPATR